MPNRGWARQRTAGVVKDAGDDPDVTHGALVMATVRRGAPGAGVTFRPAPGVGMVTRPGLPIPPGEPAINPVPRQMMPQAVAEVCRRRTATSRSRSRCPAARRWRDRTLNGRLGIVGGLSILGTTGIVIPYSCSAWIASIHRGIDVARASGLDHVAGATGPTSEAAVQKLHGLPEKALIDMGDFVGGMLKYIRKHPVPEVTVAGGVAKMTKLAQGMLDLHSKRGAADWRRWRRWSPGAAAARPLAEAVRGANTVAQSLRARRGGAVCRWATSSPGAPGRPRPLCSTGADVALEILVFDRQGELVGQAPFAPSHDPSRPLKRL